MEETGRHCTVGGDVMKADSAPVSAITPDRRFQFFPLRVACLNPSWLIRGIPIFFAVGVYFGDLYIHRFITLILSCTLHFGHLAGTTPQFLVDNF